MRRRISSIATAIALFATLWIIVSRLHIVFWVQLPWWGFLLMAVLLFLVIDYLIGRIFSR
ncbi:MAG: hypothetical protein H7Y32_18725 [Chloroflexales bacterium]|nr:hypothetical protein [Chloroflexales bacterium]